LVPAITIRRASLDDVAPLAGLMTELGYPTTVDQMRMRLLEIVQERSTRVTLVADVADEVAGMAGATLERVYEKDDLVAHLAILIVAERARRLGVGRRLVVEAEAWAAAQGAREMSLTSGLPREGAHRFYEQCGYVRNGLRFIRRIPDAS